MQFFESAQKSIYGPEYYRGLLGKPFSYSLKYYFSAVLVLAFVVTLVLSFSIVPAANTFLKSAAAKVLEYYPSELQITIKNGVASTNVAEPYFLPFPDEMKSQDSGQSGISSDTQNLFVIDTKNPFTVDEFKSYNTLGLLTKDAFVYLRKGAITIQPLDKVSNFTLNKSVVQSFFGKVEPYLAFIPPLIVLGLFLVFFVILSFELFYLLFFALLVWGFAHIRKMNIGYKKSYQLGLHLMTVVLILDALSIMFQAGIAYLPTILALFLLLLNVGGEALFKSKTKAS